MVLNIQRKFSYLQSIPGIYAIQRPYALQNPHLDQRFMQTTNGTDEDKHETTGLKSQNYEQPDISKPLYLGYNTTPQNCSSGEPLPLWSIPPLLPSNLGAFLPRVSSLPVQYYAPQGFDHDSVLLNNGINFKSDATHKLTGGDQCFDDVKVEAGGVQEDRVGEEKHSPLSQTLGFEPHRGAGKCCKS